MMVSAFMLNLHQPDRENTETGQSYKLPRSEPLQSVIIPNVEPKVYDDSESVVDIPSWVPPVTKTHHVRYNKRSIDCLATNIYHEARGEGEAGMRAVAWVVVNRLKSEHFPNNICAVVFQPGQFSWTNNQKKVDDWTEWHKIRDFTEQFINHDINKMKDSTYGSDYYYAVGSRKPDWAYEFARVTRIGNHIFYRS